MTGQTIPLGGNWKGDLHRDNNGAYRKNLSNLVLYLRNLPDFGAQLRFNRLADTVEWQGHAIEEHDYVDVRLVLERESLPFNDKDIRAAVDRVARERTFNPVVEYLSGLTWDKKPRLDKWMIGLLGAADTPFTRLVSAKVLISAVARAMEPGCKVDTVLILEGPQGISKSTAISRLFGTDWTVELVRSFEDHQKMVMATMGAWAVELAEFVAISRSDRDSVKGLLSMQRDKVVMPYAKQASIHPRGFIFFATINPDDGSYLTDTTGNRRYWPVPVTKIDLKLIETHRDQIWAEATHRYRAGEAWWLTPEEDATAKTVQTDREDQDVWSEPLASKLAMVSQTTANEALGLLGIPIERRDKRNEMRVAKALRTVGFVKTDVKNPTTGKTRKVWKRSTA